MHLKRIFRLFLKCSVQVSFVQMIDAEFKLQFYIILNFNFSFLKWPGTMSLSQMIYIPLFDSLKWLWWNRNLVSNSKRKILKGNPNVCIWCSKWCGNTERESFISRKSHLFISQWFYTSIRVEKNIFIWYLLNIQSVVFPLICIIPVAIILFYTFLLEHSPRTS